ncbi:unnamed protein product [Heligmosomoides polygyrus]|uniref:PABS domain-containing protein n=1 Tax=Heligmosomoides polygyrus TaxID=6339 RepID=A0A183FH24_HELPZ|nr:unnamed protein product [Heligmosomoides polygyrus]
MLVAPFLLTSLSLNSNNSDKKVLEIGLGGGSLDMALLSRMPEVDLTSVELDPVVVDIAKRWFGVKETNSHRIVLQDGLKFVENAAKEGKRFDVVVVDACDEAIRAPCPADAFRNAEVAQMLRDILTDTGSFVLNILSHDLEGRTSASELVKLYSSVFPACIELRFAKEVNVILACVPYSIVNIRQQLSFYNSRLTAVLSQFNLNDELGAITIV